MTQAGTTEGVTKQKKREKFLRSNWLADISFMMRSPQGRRVVCKLLKDTKVTESIYNENPNLMYFLEGNRNVGLMLLADVMEACPAEYLLMLKEDKQDGIEEEPIKEKEVEE